MKIFVSTACAGQALEFIVSKLGCHTTVERIDESEVVLIAAPNSHASGRVLGGIYSPDQLFLLLHFTGLEGDGEIDLDMPPNVRSAGSFYATDSTSWMHKLRALTAEDVSLPCERARRQGFVSHRTEVSVRREVRDGEPRVLIVDDTSAELERAVAAVPAEYGVVAVSSYHAAMRELRESAFDFVLTDLYMPALRKGEQDAYSYPLEKVGRSAPLGLLVANEARAKGASVAVVTDANHHRDPISAAFDSEGYQDLVYNNRKDWAGAFAKLLR